MSSNRFDVLGLGESNDDLIQDLPAQQRAATGRAGRGRAAGRAVGRAGRAAGRAAPVQGAEAGLVQGNYDEEFPVIGATRAERVIEPRRGVGHRADRGQEERQATKDAAVQSDEERNEAANMFDTKEAEEEAKKESGKRIVPGEIPSAHEVPKEEQAPKVTAPNPAQIIANKAAIVNSQKLEEVARLEKVYIHNFENPDKMMNLYRALHDIQHSTIARPTFKDDNSFHLNLGRGVSLMQLAREKKNLFCSYHNGAAYCASRMYVSIIRGLVKGIIQLQPTSVFVSLDVEDVFVTGGDALKNDDEKVVPVFTRYGLLPLEERGKVAKRDREKATWKELANTIERINVLIELKSTDPVIHEMVSFTNILKSSTHLMKSNPMYMNDYIQDHVLFYGWRKRKDLIFYANDMLKTEIQERRENNTFGFQNSMIDNLVLKKAFPDPSLEISRFEEYSVLRKLKMESDRYAEAKRQATSVQGHLGPPIHQNVRNSEDQKLEKYSQWIQLMRNSFAHFVENKGELNKNGVMTFSATEVKGKNIIINVKDAQGLEDLYRKVFPRAIEIIAQLVAKQERTKYLHRNPPTNYWKNNESPLHF
ncbi:hypothetical protein OROHE_002275 [Orobanche hederae]